MLSSPIQICRKDDVAGVKNEVERLKMGKMGQAWKSDYLGYNNFGFTEKPF